MFSVLVVCDDHTPQGVGAWPKDMVAPPLPPSLSPLSVPFREQPTSLPPVAHLSFCC